MLVKDWDDTANSDLLKHDLLSFEVGGAISDIPGSRSKGQVNVSHRKCLVNDTSTAWIGMKISLLNHQSKRWATVLFCWFYDTKSKVRACVQKGFGEEVNCDSQGAFLGRNFQSHSLKFRDVHR